MIVPGTHRSGSVRVRADVCVIGSGAGGATVAAFLAERGRRVVMLEAGPLVTPRDMTQREDEMVKRLFVGSASLWDDDARVRILAGRCVGGSTVHNTNICARAPGDVLETWRRNFGLESLTRARWDALYAQVETELSVTSMTDDMLNENNRILRVGMERLGYRGGLLRHNRRDCVRSGFCELGCSFDAKENALKVFIPRAVRAGATVFSDCAAERLEIDGRRVTRVRSRDVEVDADLFCLSGGALGTPALLERSNAPDPHSVAGRGLHLHPGVAVAGWMGQEVRGWEGIPQSYECTQFLDRDVWLLTAFAHPIGVASMLPGFGVVHDAWMRRYPELAVVAAMVHDRGEGRVRDGGNGDGSIRVAYAMDARDRAALALGVREACRILLAAGAREVLLPSGTRRLRSFRELDALDDGALLDEPLPLTAVHPMGTARMGGDPTTSVVNAQGRHHHLDNLFVADTALFPTALGAPPQMSTYALARHVAEHMAAA